MSKIKVNNDGSIAEYPYGYFQFILDNFNTGAVAGLIRNDNLTDQALAAMNVYPVKEVTVQTEIGQQYYESTPVFENGEWVQTFTTDPNKAVYQSEESQQQCLQLFDAYADWKNGVISDLQLLTLIESIKSQ